MLKYIENKANSVPQQALSGAGLTLAKRNKNNICMIHTILPQNYALFSFKRLQNRGVNLNVRVVLAIEFCFFWIIIKRNYVLAKKNLDTGFGWLFLDNLGRSKNYPRF